MSTGEYMYPELWTIPIINYTIKSYGFMLMIGFFTGSYMAAKRAEKLRCNPDLVLNCAILSLIGSMAGARLFYVVHYWDKQFAHLENPLWSIVDISKGGMELFGGIAGAMVAVLTYLLIKRESIRLYLDIFVPTLMWGIAFGRLGCFLNGCCWGGVCQDGLANNWALSFPYGSPAHYQHYQDRLVKLPAELLKSTPIGEFGPLPREHVFLDPAKRDKYARLLAEARERSEFVRRLGLKSPEAAAAQDAVTKYEKLAEAERTKYAALSKALASYPSSEYVDQKITPSELQDLASRSSLAVHPAQLYSTVNAFLASLFLTMFLRCRRRHGMVFVAWLLTYPWTRVILEHIRADNPLDTFGLTISSALGLGMVAVGIILAYLFSRMPLHSPYARAWEPPDDQEPVKNPQAA